MQRLTHHRRGRSAFTLIELLTVIGIILVLLALIAGVIGKVREKARRAQMLNFIKNVEHSAKLFQLAYNRWPWDIQDKTLAQKLPASDIFAELAPGNAALTPLSYPTLINQQRIEYLAIEPAWIRNGHVVDLWGNELEFFWNPDTCNIVIVAPGANRVNDTVDTGGAGRLRAPAEQADDINNL